VEVNTSLWDKKDHIVIAVSTGIDSMCLLHSLIYDLSHTYARISCLHINHGLREASQQEEEFIRHFCAQHEVPCYVKHLDLSELVQQGRSIQADARQQRYTWFDKMMQQLEADVLLTAHHLNDQLETIFYRIFTGRSTRSSLGMDDMSWRGHYKLCRPLLNTYKSYIHSYQQLHQVPYYEDASNSDNKYARNDIRNRLLPSIDDNVDLDTAQLLKLKAWHDIQLQHTRQRVNEFTQHEVAINTARTRIQFSRNAFNQLDNITKMVLLDQLFESIHLRVSLSEKNYEEWFEQINSRVAQIEITLSETWIIQIAYDKFIIMAKKETPALKAQVVTQPGTYYFGKYVITIHAQNACWEWPLTIRTRRNGDKIKMNGREGHKKVSRLFIDNKVSNDERENMPLIEDQQHTIIAVGHLYIKTNYKNNIDIKKLEMNDK